MPDWDKDDDFGTMDQLDYQYFDGSNRLRSVSDGILKNDTSGKGEFVDGNKDGDDYVYDPNGNMTQDLNKGIKGTTPTEKGIEYNHLNLPTKVSIDDGGANKGTISYIYDATGVKLRKNVLKQGETTPTATDYAGNYIYENNTLQFFSTPEGYVEPKNPDNLAQGYDYIYQYKDHLGNIRLSYKNVGTASNVDLEIQEENNYYPFGLEHKGYNSVVNSSNIAQDWKFNGVEFEEALGLDLCETFARGYDPALGRFMQIDPLGELIQQIDKSPYNFAWNNPIAFNDPLGFCPDCPDPADAQQDDTYTIDNGSVYVFNEGEWERQTVVELDEVVVTPDSSTETSSDGAMAAVAVGAVATEAIAAEALLAELAVVGTELGAAAAPAAAVVLPVAIMSAPLLYISYQDPAPPLYMPESGPISTTANYQPRPTTAPPNANPPAFQPLTAEEALLISAYMDQMAEHRKNKRGSNKPKHEKGQTRKGRDRGGERGDSGRRPPRKRPPGWKGPWPPQ